MTAPKPAAPRSRPASLLDGFEAAKRAKTPAAPPKPDQPAELPEALRDAIAGLTMAETETERLETYAFARDHGWEKTPVRCRRRACSRWTTSTDGVWLPGLAAVMAHIRTADKRADRDAGYTGTHSVADFVPAPRSVRR